ncbi:HEAT repeat domain-containing protein [Kitasatospora sp. NPDC085879]|uniref:HEAT repeat domain-containing protein n=1 Tax=Kitasatospora sp. NPDC085879 TaxID=3154769 RepID=UPI003439388E
MREIWQNIHEIDWSGLTHCYGPADDVPPLLMALRSPNQSDRQSALHRLYGKICHQGDRFAASAEAVPFFLDLVADEDAPDRLEILGLLVSLALGDDTCCLPHGITLAGLAQWRNEIQDIKHPVVNEHQDDRYDIHALRSYEAVALGVPVFQRLLTESDSLLRLAAVHALAWFPQYSATSIPDLLRAAEKDVDPTVAASALLSVALLAAPGDRSFDGLLESALDSKDMANRKAAAFGLARLHAPTVDGRIVDELASTMFGWCGGVPGLMFPFWNSDPISYAAYSLMMLESEGNPYAFEAMLGALPRLTHHVAHVVGRALLEIAFEAPVGPDGRFVDLSARQRDVVVAIATASEAWRTTGEISKLARSVGLPDNMADLCRFAGLATPPPRRPTEQD